MKKNSGIKIKKVSSRKRTHAVNPAEFRNDYRNPAGRAIVRTKSNDKLPINVNVVNTKELPSGVLNVIRGTKLNQSKKKDEKEVTLRGLL